MPQAGGVASKKGAGGFFDCLPTEQRTSGLCCHRSNTHHGETDVRLLYRRTYHRGSGHASRRVTQQKQRGTPIRHTSIAKRASVVATAVPLATLILRRAESARSRSAAPGEQHRFRSRRGASFRPASSFRAIVRRSTTWTTSWRFRATVR